MKTIVTFSTVQMLIVFRRDLLFVFGHCQLNCVGIGHELYSDHINPMDS